MKRLLVALMAATLAATVMSAQVGKATGQHGEKLLLSDQQGDCPDGGQMAAFVSDAGVIPGCWFARMGFVWVMFASGEVLALPQKAFKFEDV